MTEWPNLKIPSGNKRKRRVKEVQLPLFGRECPLRKDISVCIVQQTRNPKECAGCDRQGGYR